MEEDYCDHNCTKSMTKNVLRKTFYVENMHLVSLCCCCFYLSLVTLIAF